MEIVRHGMLGVGLTASLLACSTGDDAPAREPATDDVSPAAVKISVANRAFQAPDTIDARWTTWHFTNDTDEDVHYAHFVRLDSGRSVPELVEYYARAIRESGPRPTWIVRFGGPGAAGPRQTASVTQDLAPGSYVLICPVENEKGEPHFGVGEYHPFVVRATKAEAAGAAAEPVASATIRLVDHAFVPDSSLMKAGRHTIRVENGGREPHDMNMMKLAPGRTLEDLRRVLNPERARRPGDKDEPPPPFDELGSMVGGIAAMAPSMSAYFDADLTPGEYLLFCMVTAPDGRSHIEHGMIRQIRIQ
jgi:hypothetical protein